MDKLKQLLEKRAELIAEAEKIAKKAEEEKRAMTSEEASHFDDLGTKIEAHTVEIQQLQQQQERQDRLGTWREMLTEPSGRQTAPSNPGSGGDPGGQRDNPSAVTLELRSHTMTYQQSADGLGFYRRGQDAYARAYASYLLGGLEALDVNEYRALQADSDTAGGFLVPTQYVARLIKFVDDMTFIRQWATMVPVGQAESLGVPSLDADPADSDWTGELLTGDEDSAMTFGGRVLQPHPLAKRIKVSNKLIRVSAIAVEDLVLRRLAYKFGVTEEKAYMTGTGANQPLGLFTASSKGISTSRDVSTGNTATEIRFDGLMEALYTLKGQYWAASRWLFHRDALKQIRKLKDGDGRYLWEPSTQVGQPDMLLGHPVYMSEFAPNTFTTGQYVGMIADFSHYWIADALQMSVQRLVELYAETNQVGFIGRLESDAMPTLEEAFVRVKLG